MHLAKFNSVVILPMFFCVIRTNGLINKLPGSLLRRRFHRSPQNHMSPPPPSILFVLGGPGSGKGTQAELLARDFGLKHVSVGELLRQEMRTGSKDSELIRDVLSKGHIVPAEISVRLLRNDIIKQKCSHYIVDGELKSGSFCYTCYRSLTYCRFSSKHG
jgi:hypothetical protein